MKNFENVSFWFENNGSVKGFPSIYFHDTELEPSMDNFVEDIVATAKMFMETENHNDVVIEKAEGMVLNFIKNGEFFGSTKIGVYIDYEHAQDKLPNDDDLVSLEYYDWSEFEALQKVA